MDTMPPDRPAPKRRWVWVAGAGVIMVAIVAGLMARQPASSNTTPTDGQTTQKSASSKNCLAQTPQFTADFTDPKLITQVGPLGGLNVGSASRSYIQVNREAGQYVTVPLYAPVDATLTGIYFKQANYGDQGARGEYRLEFEASCDVTFAFDHIATVTDEIKQAGSATPAAESNVGTNVSIPIKAGDRLGSTDGTKISGNWDFYLFNRAKPSDHVNQDRWQSDHNNYADCPYDYFTADLKNQYYQKLALWDGQKPAGLTCGQASHDVADSASGGWFQGDATDMQGTKLLLSNTATMVEVLREVAGALNQADNDRFGFRTYMYAKMPREMRAGDAVCYSGDNKYLFAKLTSGSTLQTARGSGACPTTFPTTDIENWQR